MQDGVLAPLSCSLQVTIKTNLSPAMMEFPRYQVELDVDNVEMSMTDAQYRDMLAVSASFMHYKLYLRRLEWRRQRPAVRPLEDVRACTVRRCAGP